MVSKTEVVATAKDMFTRLYAMRLFIAVQVVIVLLCVAQAIPTKNAFKLLGMGMVLVALTAIPVIVAVVLRSVYVNTETTTSIPRRLVPEVEPAADAGAENPAVAGNGTEAVESTAAVPEAGVADASGATASS